MLKVLIVDDSEMLRELFAEYLEAVGFCVVGVVGTVPEAIEAAHAKCPDVALLDYQLGRQLGPEIFAQVPPPQRPAILYLSGRPLDQMLTTANAEAYIQKPVSLQDLAAALTAVWVRRTSGSASNIAVPNCLRWLDSYARKLTRFA
ncbi:DNA-binding response OmpR family regulator [Bosea sp. OAE506]|uniref:response regulator n=1 Tax=Bosea sp. OAE506 TaxID=2663870 RepID=UPI0017893077